MRTLFLISEEEKIVFPRELLIKDVDVHTDSKILYELGKQIYDVAYITRRYKEAYTTDVVISAIEFLIKFTNTKIKYLIYSDDYIDDVHAYLLSIGNGNIFKEEIKNLNIDSFDYINKKEKEIDRLMIEPELPSPDLINLMRVELSELTDETSIEYIKNNKSKIIDIFSSYLSEKTLLARKLEHEKKLEKDLFNTNEKVKTLNRSISKLESKNERYKENLNSLRRSVLANKVQIDEYNESLKNNGRDKEGILQLGNYKTLIIYFKEIENIGFFNYFDDLVFLINNIYSFYTKTIILENSNRSYFDPYTPKGYQYLPKGVEKKHIIDSDKIVRYGNCLDLIAELVKMEYRTDAIIIYDRTGSANLKVNADAENVVPFYIGTSRDIIPSYEFDDNSWISPIEGKWKRIAPLLDFGRINSSDYISFKSVVTKFPLSEYVVSIIRDQVMGG